MTIRPANIFLSPQDAIHLPHCFHRVENISTNQSHSENPTFEGILEYIWTISLLEDTLFNLCLTESYPAFCDV